MPSDIKPWTIKGVFPEVRNAALAAALRNEMPMGEWLAHTIVTQLRDEAERAASPVQQLERPTPASAGSALDLIERVTQLTVALAPEAIPESIRQAAVELLLAELKAAQRRLVPAGL